MTPIQGKGNSARICVLPKVLEFLPISEQCRLLTLNKQVHSLVLNPQMEFQRLKEAIVITSGCWTPQMHRALSSWRSKASPKTWLCFLGMLFEDIKKDQCEPELRYEKWVWRRRQDPLLDRLVHQWRCLCPSWQEGLNDPQCDEFIREVAVYDMVRGNVHEFCECAKGFGIEDFVKTTIPSLEWLICLGDEAKLSNFMRFVSVPSMYQWKAVLNWYALQLEAMRAGNLFSRSRDELKKQAFKLFLSPIVARLLLQQPDLMSRIEHMTPIEFFERLHSFEPWTAGGDQVFGYDIMELLQAQSSIWSMELNQFWDLSLKVPTDSDVDLKAECHTNKEAFLKRGLRFMQRLERHIVGEIEEHLNFLKLEAFDQIPCTTKEIAVKGDEAPYVLELSLTEADTGPNPKVSSNDHQGEVGVFTMGVQSAILYRRHNDHC
eukprot:Blabericola_migrator_1__12128@NODE_748_length_6661_cov_222_679102_g536_i0_p4_GENE_NODE_748_length_6661_cov_222_679102_g536_i0NODE_748_length_6661_cov_222_679102_g536_i0_p4_ORF_typecomplete_len433_score65_70_NODE_748_length_6661_cov_222_679102_g536_i032714569